MKKKVILSEGQLLRLVNEALSQTLYHWTSIQAAYKILTSNTLFCQSSLAGGGADNMSDKYKFYVSMARNKTNKEGFSTSYTDNSARIEFDGDALNQRFAGGPVNYWGAGDLYNKWTYMRNATGIDNGDNFYYKETDTIPQGAEVKKRDKFPVNPTANSPEFIKIGKQYYQKVNDKRNVKKQIAYEYIPVDQVPEGIDIKEITSSFDKKYPSEYSPEYASFEGKVYHKERVIPRDIQQHHDNEMEDRLFTDKPFIEGIHQYIKRIDLIVSDFNELPDGLKRIVYNFALTCGNCYIYDNERDFNHQTDNTINNKIKNIEGSFIKYGQTLEDGKTGHITDVLARFLNLLTLHISDGNEKNKTIALYLRNNGLENEIRPVIQKMRSIYGNVEMLISELSIDVQNISKSPTIKGQKALGFIAKVFRERGWKNWDDVKTEIKGQFDPDKKWEDIDTRVKKTRTLMTVNYYTYDVTDDMDTDFWHIFRYDDMRDRYYFIEHLIDNLNYATNGNWERDGEWVNNVRDKDKTKFQKYLQNLAHKKVTLRQMMRLLNQIGYSTEQMMGDFGWDISYKQNTYDYWSYIWDSDIQVPYKSKYEYDSDARDEYAKKIYRKENDE